MAQKKDEALVELDEMIAGELKFVFPGITAKTHIPTPKFDDFLKGATLLLKDNLILDSKSRDASSFGHGAQRTVQMSLIKCLADVKKRNDPEGNRTTLLLIDEPELYLHPYAIEMVSTSLKRLSKQGYQVVFSTHSASMITRNDVPETLLIRRSADKGTECLPRMTEAVRAKIDGASSQADILFSLSNASRILFSEKVLLAEGKTESKLLPDLFQCISGKTMGEEGLALVAAGSSSDLVKSMSVLSAMGIQCKALADIDFAFRSAIEQRVIPRDHPAVLKVKDVFSEMEKNGEIQLDSNGFPRRYNGVSSAMAFEMMANKTECIDPINELHELLKENGIWIWTKGAIEAHLGLATKSETEHRQFLEKIEDPASLEALRGYSEMIAFIDWIKQ